LTHFLPLFSTPSPRFYVTTLTLCVLSKFRIVNATFFGRPSGLLNICMGISAGNGQSLSGQGNEMGKVARETNRNPWKIDSPSQFLATFSALFSQHWHCSIIAPSGISGGSPNLFTCTCNLAYGELSYKKKEGGEKPTQLNSGETQFSSWKITYGFI